MLRPDFPLQTGHDNWIRALTFHPNGKYLLSASDDKTVRVWDLSLGKLWKTIDAHDHFVSCMSWGRTSAGATTATSANSVTSGKEVKRRVNVMATGSVDQTIKVGPDTRSSKRMPDILHTFRSGCHDLYRMFATSTLLSPFDFCLPFTERLSGLKGHICIAQHPRLIRNNRCGVLCTNHRISCCIIISYNIILLTRPYS